MSDPLKDALNKGLEALGLALEVDTRERLIRFVRLIERWNKVYNLTAVRDPLEMVSRHLLDSLALLPHLPAGRVLDLGTGAGLPGIPLALARPGQEFVLLDAVAKKIRFCTQAAIELGLDQVKAVHGRVEQYQPDPPIEVVITRAFADLGATLALVRPILAGGGQLLALKGQLPEARELPEGARVVPLQVPGTDASRCVVAVEIAPL